MAVCVLCGECGASSDFSPAGREYEAAAAWNTRAPFAGDPGYLAALDLLLKHLDRDTNHPLYREFLGFAAAGRRP